MKTYILLAALLTSVSAFAAEFNVKIEGITCSLSNGTVTRTHTIGNASFTEKKTISTSGFDALISKAAETASETPVTNEFYSFKMKHEGKTYTLNTEDSNESLVLIQLLSKICR